MAAELQVGDKPPDFSLPDENGETVSVKSLKVKQVVLYFYPKDDTPGCTKEACGFRDSLSAIEKANPVVLCVSMDNAESHQNFIQKYSLPFTLLCDEDGKVSKAYGVYKKKKDRKSTRLNSSHLVISYAVFCLKKKKKNTSRQR